MTTSEIERWAEDIASHLANYQNEAHYEFESCFDDYIATVVWTCDIVVEKGDYFTSSSWDSVNEKIEITVVDADGFTQPAISTQLVEYLS